MGGIQRFEHRQQSVSQARTQGWRIVQGFDATRQLQQQPLPFAVPKVGWVDAFSAAQLHDGALLGKKRHRRGLVAPQYPLYIVHHGTAGALYAKRGVVVTNIRPLYEFVCQGLQ